MDSEAPLLPLAPASPALESAPSWGWWRFWHTGGFLTGGVTFLFGTWVLDPFSNDSYDQENTLAILSSSLYTLGSLGFLLVDVLEFFTFTREIWLRVNICISMAGSFFYVLGSLGFAPPITAAAPALGALGFLVGSALIAASQAWKVARLCGAPRQPPPHPREDAPLALGVETGAGLGALFFLVGTALFMQGWTTGGQLTAVLWIWAAGSAFFTAGGVCLWWRHYKLGLA